MPTGVFTKAELITEVRQANRILTRFHAYNVVETLFEIIGDGICYDGFTRISGFGKFSLQDKKERQGRDPNTGRPIRLAARRIVVFKPSKVLRARVNAPSSPADGVLDR